MIEQKSLKDRLLTVPVGLGAALLLAAIAAPLVMSRFNVPPYQIHILIVGFYFATLASSWALLAGYAGQFSFAHMAFMAIGAYTAGILGQRLGTSVLAGIIIGVLIAGLWGFLIGVLCLRLRRTYLALFTIAFSEITRLIFNAERQVTGGPDGMSFAPLVPSTTSNIPPYYIHLALLIGSLAVMYALANSRFGLFWRSIREDEEAAAAMGVHVVRYKVMVFVITAMIAGLAGAVHWHYVSILTPNDMLIRQMSIVITMAVIGGIESLFAAAIGAIAIEYGLELMRPLGNWRLVAFGLLLMITLRFFQNGLLYPLLQRLYRRGVAAQTVAKRQAAAEEP
ncbi:MAG: branched-chain amino acid ABC transporter permease [Chloroflexota bacterium]|nr:MAG: branched-chain amino acid ABC transporter permease [Chloroflexota bacterium]